MAQTDSSASRPWAAFRSTGVSVPRGPVHESVNLTALALGVIAFHRLVPDGGAALPAGSLEAFVAGYLLGSVWITPDLDLAERRNKPRPARLWGWFRLLWVPYGQLFRHRGLSHTWVVGPITRILYIVLILEGVRYGLSLLPGMGSALEPLAMTKWLLSPVGIAGLAGYFVSQWLHLALDRAFEPRRRKRAPGARGRQGEAT